MESTVTSKNMVSIPRTIAREFGIQPGWKLDWKQGANPEEILVRVIPDRAERAHRLLGKGKSLGPGRDAIAELLAEREEEE